MSLWKIQGLSFKAKAKVKDSTIKDQDKDKAMPLSKIVLKDTSRPRTRTNNTEKRRIAPANIYSQFSHFR